MVVSVSRSTLGAPRHIVGNASSRQGADRPHTSEVGEANYLHELRSSRPVASGPTIGVMKIKAVTYELTDTRLGKDEPSAEHQAPLSKVPEILRGCRSERVKSVMS